MKLKTIESLATALNRSKSAVSSNWLGHPEWPYGRKSPWDSRDVPKMLAWAERTFTKPASESTDAAIRSITNNPEKIARIKVLLAREKKLTLETGILGKEYIRRDEVQSTNVMKILAVRAKLAELPLRSSLIAHKGEQECERILLEWAKEICNYFAGVPE